MCRVWEIRSQHYVISREKETKKKKRKSKVTLPGCDLSSPWMVTKNWNEAESKGQVGAMPRNEHGGKKKRVGNNRRGREEQRWREKEKD